MIDYTTSTPSKKLITIFLISISFVTCSAQVIEEKGYSKLVIPRNQVYLVTVDTLEVDTLLMQDNSTLKFTQDIVITIHNAFIGSKCEFNSSGSKGESKRGGDGISGKHLTIQILFKKLNSLRINTSGGDGGQGSAGRPGIDGSAGTDGTDGQNGGNGGNGGDAGDIRLYYIAEGFIPQFNGAKNRINTINFIYTGGKPGKGGSGGSGGSRGEPITRTDVNSKKTSVGNVGRNGFNGRDGAYGHAGKNGELIFRRIE